MLTPRLCKGLSATLPALYLNQADFHAFLMTRRSTVAFADGPDYTWYVIDGPGLATGQMAILEFGANGQVRDSILCRPWNIDQVVLFGEMGRRVADLAESSIGGPPRINEPYVLFYRFLACFLYSDKDSVSV